MDSGIDAGMVLARTADRLRSEAASGLFWNPGTAEAGRLRALRGLSAALLAEVDVRDLDEVTAIVEHDPGLRTPGSAVAVLLRSADGAMVMRH